MSELAPPGEERALLARATAAAGDVRTSRRPMLTSRRSTDELDPASPPLAERAVELARRVGDARLRAPPSTS